jgi:predicted phage-related endonuclease
MINTDVTKDRHLYIGGSDIASICGTYTDKDNMKRQCGFHTPYEVYLMKKGEITTEYNIQMEIGKRLEPVIRGLYLDYTQDETNTKTHTKSDDWVFNDYEIIHPDFPFLKVHLDGYNKKDNIILECKSTSNRINELPIGYKLQVAFQCLVSDAKEAHVAVLSNTNTFNVFTYNRNPSLEKLLLKESIKFWECVKTNTPPICESLEDIRKRNERVINCLSENHFIADSYTYHDIKHYQELNNDLKERANMLDLMKVELMNKFEKSEVIVDEDGNDLATYKFNKTASPTVNKELLKKDFPDVWEKVKVDRVPTRVFRVKKGI